MAKASKTADDDVIPEGDAIAEAIKKLSPDEAEFFLSKLEAVMMKRKLQLTGYLVALGVWLVTMFLALAYYGTHDGFVGWVFLVPFALVGGVLYAFGRWAEKISPSAKPATKPPAK